MVRPHDSTQVVKDWLAGPRLCPICRERPVEYPHHVVPRGSPNFGDDVAANIVPLCGDGTRGCHGDVEARRNQAREKLGAYLQESRPDTIAYVRKKIEPGGDAWLERHYGIASSTNRPPTD